MTMLADRIGRVNHPLSFRLCQPPSLRQVCELMPRLVLGEFVVEEVDVVGRVFVKGDGQVEGRGE